MRKLGVTIFIILVVILGGVGFILTKNTKSITDNKTENVVTNTQKVESSFSQQIPSPTTENKVCSWVDDSDIVIKLNFADGVTKDTSYEAGFYYNAITSSMRLARKECDYRTGFSYSEMKNKGTVQVGVRGYSDNIRRQLNDEPINIIFDENGKPNITTPIEVTILN